MNSQNKKQNIFAFLKSHLLLRLWAASMIIVGIAVVFLWVVQILLFEPNYLDATMNALLGQVQESAQQMEAAGDIEPGSFEDPLHYLSKTITGRLFIVDEDGKILVAYNNGTIDTTENLGEGYQWLLYKSDDVIAGNILKRTDDFQKDKTIITVGIRSEYQGQPVAIMLYSNIDDIDTMLALNRQQLIILSIVLTLVASLVAFITARHFARPIQKIKNTVEKLTEGEYTAQPDVKRSDELGQLAGSVEVLGEELQRVDVLRKEVIANVSHELRAPLALIAGYSEMVRDVTGDIPDKRNQNMDLIIRETGRLSEMVDDIMDYSQMQAGYSKLKLDTYNLAELAESSAEFGRSIGQTYNIEVAYEDKTGLDDIPVEIDALKMSQVMRNLLNNAVNHTDGGGTVTVALTKMKSGAIRVSVRNPGDPIPPDQQKAIWERYQRVQHQGGHKEGTGIGLAIVSTILTAHGFEYGADSSDGYNEFWFEIRKLNR